MRDIKGRFVLGHKHTDAVRQKLSEDNLKNPRRYWLGKSRFQGIKRGAESHFWRGGVTSINKIIRESAQYKTWRTSVFERDGYVCVWCGAKSGQGRTVELQADHIKSFARFPKLRLSISNGRTLCRPCHLTTENFGGKSKKHV